MVNIFSPLYRHISDFINKYEIIFLVLIFVGLSLFYFLSNKEYSGPAYLSDEIGYLTKAIYFAGHEVDAASSWHAGYALIISPLFAFINDTRQVWSGIVAINSLLFSSSVILIYFLTKISLGVKRVGLLLLASIVVGLYPAMAVMSGYAFSSSLILFMFSLSLLLLVKSKLEFGKSLTAFAFITGFLYWVHPTSIAPIAVSIAMFVFLAILKSKKRYLWLILPVVALPAVYQLIISPHLLTAMTPEGLSYTTHYEQSLPSIHRLTEPGYLKRTGAMFLGQTSYVLVATLGLFAVGFTAVDGFIKGFFSHKMKKRYVNRMISNNSATIAFVYVVPVVLLTALVGSAMFANSYDVLGVHYWIYGRYTETMLIPLLGILLLSKIGYKTLTRGMLVLVSGSLVLNYLVTDKTTDLGYINLINTQAFWPQSLIAETDILLWFAVAVLASVLMFFVFRFSKTLSYIVFAVVYVFCINHQLAWHTEIVEGYSRPSAVAEYVNDNFKDDDCVGFDNLNGRRTEKIERFELYSFYMYRFDFRRMEFADWANNCSGIYLTFDKDKAEWVSESDEYEIVGVEIPTYLYVIGKKGSAAENARFYKEETGFMADNKDNYTITAESMRNYTDIGYYEDGELIARGDKGFLLYGPAFALEKGSYELELDISGLGYEDNVRVDVVTNYGASKYLDKRIVSNGGRLIFNLNKNVLDLEVRISVGAGTEVSFKEYTINKLK